MRQKITTELPDGRKIISEMPHDNDIHIIYHGKNKWALVKPNRIRAIKIHKFRELAFLHATQIISDNAEIIVHTEDAKVDFTYKNGKII